MSLSGYVSKYLTLTSLRNLRYASTVVDLQHGRVDRSFNIGSVFSGFRVKKVQNIPEFQLSVINLEHINTGAEYLHFDRNDTNNVFCVGFKTTPLNSTGVPHILEHTVLCGSEKYPCRDPFFKMLNRSLATFMNAMTGSDYTIYPFSTQHPVDYKNLMSIYLDSVFKPNLSEIDFLQEGWRLEHENPDDQSSLFVLKGVVFNEMKGVFADSQSLFLQKLQNGLFPSHTYSYISGGDPLEIPSLSWKDLKDFHANHYHPSNCHFFSYGNFPLESQLKFINDNYLSKFQKIYPNTEVPSEPRWNEYKRSHIPCGFDAITSKDRQSCVAVSYLLSNIHDTSENFILSILSELLMNGPNSPFYKSLIESQYGTNFTVGSGFDGHTRDTSFTIGIQGVEESQIDPVINAIERTFDQTISEGFSEEQIEGVLHDIELGIKHQTSNFGLKLIMSLTPLCIHRGDLTEALEINKKINLFRKNIKNNPKFLQSKLEKYFKNNNHKYILSMSPDSNYEFSQLNAEKSLLQSKLNNLTDQGKEIIWAQGQLLKSKQEEITDLSCLPTLHVSDISRSLIPTLVQDLKLHGNIPLQLCEQPTNGVTYFKLMLDIKNLPENLHAFVPLFCGVLTEMGAGDLDFRSLSQKIGLVSGGLSANIHVTEYPETNNGSYEEGIILSSHCLHNNLEPMLDLWVKILNEIKLDDISRFTALIKMYANEKANGLVHSGHNYAMSYASSSINFVSHLKEQWGGITHLQMLKCLSEAHDLVETLDKVKEIASTLLQNCTLRIAVNTLADTSNDATDKVDKFLNKINCNKKSEKIKHVAPSSFSPQTSHTHHVFPFPVNFAAKAFTCLPYTHPDSGAMRVLARLMFQYLHKEVREKGGAYGGGAVSSPGSPFSFYSYRDPHSTKTLMTFDSAIEWVLKGSFTSQDVHEAILGVFQSVDSPISPGSKGMPRFLYHISDEMFSEHRRSILDTEAQDLIRVCRTHLREANYEGSCLIGPQNESLQTDPLWVKFNHN